MGRMRAWASRLFLACLGLLAGALAIACQASPPPTPGAPTLDTLTAEGEGRAMYPPFDPETYHYAVGCGDSGTLTLTLSAHAADTRVTVNDVVHPNGDAVQLRVSGDSDTVVALENAAGSATYTVHCLPPDFPTVTVRKSAGASDILISARMGPFIGILDTNGVPRFHRKPPNFRKNFQYHPEGLYPYSYTRKEGIIPTSSEERPELINFQVVVLDWDLSIVDVVQVVPPLTHTDNHDFDIKANGNYVLMAYEPTRRDFSSRRDPDGNPYSTTEGTADSVIQEITPQREQVFLWNSWDHMAVMDDCLQHHFPWGYAHLNSVNIVDGDFIASFRGCAQVLRIDGTTGDVIWRLGKSHRSDADWIASGSPAPLKIVGDPYGEFCGQHAAHLRPNGNLVLYDNGVHCSIDPETGTSARTGGIFSRAVEYAIDTASGQAVFQRHHALHGTFDRAGYAEGHVALLDNGNWLVSWGRGSPHPDESITEVDPLTGRELLSIVITDGEQNVLATRAYPLPPDALEWRPVNSLLHLEPGWNRIVWRGRDGIPVEEALHQFPIAAIETWDAPSLLRFSPDAPPGVNTLTVLTAGQRYRVDAR